MKYRTIDMTTYPRSAHFAHFSAMPDPYVGVTVELEIGGFLDACRQANHPFFLSFLYCVGRAANAVPELRQRIWQGGIMELETCDTSHTVLRSDGTYRYCRLNCMQPFAQFLPEAKRLHAAAKDQADLDDGEDAISLLFISSVPWLHYTALHQPVPTPADSNPRITWGQYTTRPGGWGAYPAVLQGTPGRTGGICAGKLPFQWRRSKGVNESKIRRSEGKNSGRFLSMDAEYIIRNAGLKRYTFSNSEKHA